MKKPKSPESLEKALHGGLLFDSGRLALMLKPSRNLAKVRIELLAESPITGPEFIRAIAKIGAEFAKMEARVNGRP